MTSDNTTTSDQSTSSFAAASAAGGDKKRAPWWWIPALGAMFVLIFCLFAPLDRSTPQPGVDELDASWAAVLHWAHAHQVDFGQQIIFTHGPWGFTSLPNEPGTFMELTAVWLLLSAAFFAAIVRVARQMTDTCWVAAIWLLAVILLTGPPINMVDARMLPLSWLLLLIHFYIDDRPWSPAKILLALGIALVSLIKFSLLFAGLPVLAVVTIDQAWRRRFPSMLAVYAAALVAFWLAAGQPLGSFVPYLKHSWQLADGYVEGEAIYTPTEIFDVGQFVLTALLFLAALALVHPWNRKVHPQIAHGVLDEVARPVRPPPPPIEFRQSVLAMAGSAALVFVIFKGGYVRHDVHEIAATAALALMAVTLSAALWPRINGGVAQTFLVLLSFGAIYLSWGSQMRFAFSGGPENMLAELKEIPDRVGDIIDGLRGDAGAPAGQSDRPAEISPLPKVTGTVDIYSWGQRQLLDEGLDYHPRPIFQSYLTFTDALCELNAQFVAGPGAAQNILLNLETIDHHYFSQDDSRSWPELLTRYDLEDAGGSHLLLQKAAAPREFTLVPIGTRLGRMGHWVTVPRCDDPVWVSMGIQLTPLGQLARLAYKPPALLLGIKTVSQPPQTFRFMRESAQGGFLLSPQVSDRMAFGLLYSSYWKQQLVDAQVAEVAVSVAMSPMGTSPCYDDEFPIQFYALRFPHTDVLHVPGMTDYLRLREIFRNMNFVRVEPNNLPQLVDNLEGKIVIKAPALTRMMIPVPPKAHDFDFGYGMLSSSYNNSTPTDGVVFRVYLVDAMHGREISAGVTWGKEMYPGTVSADRGLHHGTVHLPTGKPIYGLLLETNPGPDHRLSDSYWTDLSFR